MLAAGASPYAARWRTLRRYDAFTLLAAAIVSLFRWREEMLVLRTVMTQLLPQQQPTVQSAVTAQQ
jgi:hypothetical protein